MKKTETQNFFLYCAELSKWPSWSLNPILCPHRPASAAALGAVTSPHHALGACCPAHWGLSLSQAAVRGGPVSGAPGTLLEKRVWKKLRTASWLPRNKDLNEEVRADSLFRPHPFSHSSGNSVSDRWACWLPKDTVPRTGSGQGLLWM